MSDDEWNFVEYKAKYVVVAEILAKDFRKEKTDNNKNIIHLTKNEKKNKKKHNLIKISRMVSTCILYILHC